MTTEAQDPHGSLRDWKSAFDLTGARITVQEPTLVMLDITSAMADPRFLKLKKTIDDIVRVKGWDSLVDQERRDAKFFIHRIWAACAMVMHESPAVSMYRRSQSFGDLRGPPGVCGSSR